MAGLFLQTLLNIRFYKRITALQRQNEAIQSFMDNFLIALLKRWQTKQIKRSFEAGSDPFEQNKE
jgi:hypothetical protein